MVITVYTY